MSPLPEVPQPRRFNPDAYEVQGAMALVQSELQALLAEKVLELNRWINTLPPLPAGMHYAINTAPLMRPAPDDRDVVELRFRAVPAFLPGHPANPLVGDD